MVGHLCALKGVPQPEKGGGGESKQMRSVGAQIGIHITECTYRHAYMKKLRCECADMLVQAMSMIQS